MFTYWSIPIYLFFFIIYLEFSPSLGNILYRINSNGDYYFNFYSLLQFFYLPFINSSFWYELLDLNIYFGIYITNLLFYYISYISGHPTSHGLTHIPNA